MSLPTYDPHRPCPKCGHLEAATRYREFSPLSSRELGGLRSYDRDACSCPLCTHTDFSPEHLARRCLRCQYEWAEGVAGAGGSEKVP